MLYLVRKVNQSIIINNTIEVKIDSISKNSVKLAITSGESDVILREEVFAKIAKENKDSGVNLKELEVGKAEQSS